MVMQGDFKSNKITCAGCYEKTKVTQGVGAQERVDYSMVAQVYLFSTAKFLTNFPAS
jgi:hypothetical protein